MVSGDIDDLKNKSNQLEQEIDKVRDDSRRLVDEELDKLAERLQQKVVELEAICGKNEKHVENLRELNIKLMDDMERSKLDSLDKMDEKIEAVRKEIPNIDESDFASLVESKFQLEAKLNDLLERSKIISDELDDTKKVSIKSTNRFSPRIMFITLEILANIDQLHTQLRQPQVLKIPRVRLLLDCSCQGYH